MKRPAALLMIVLLSSACAFEFELDQRKYKCENNDDCLVDDGYQCGVDGECERAAANPDTSRPCVDKDGDGWFVGPQGCLTCPEDEAACDPANPLPDLLDTSGKPGEDTYPGAFEICDGVDNNGDGTVDTDDPTYINQNCSKQLGVCEGAVRLCGGDGGYQACGPAQYGEGYADEELCGDGIDNDCDGVFDPPDRCDCLAGQEEPCREAMFGECADFTGTRVCDGGEWGDCEGATLPEAERCDGKDNDCDNETDEAAREGEEPVCGDCPFNMVKIDDRWCVDRMEESQHPDVNVRAAAACGAPPLVALSFDAALQRCLNAGKQLCPVDVWTTACGGTGGSAYPYGAEHEPDLCAEGAGVQPSCSQPQCVSRWNSRGDNEDNGLIYDMSGNVEEWVKPPDNDPGARIVAGGAWNSAATDQLKCDARRALGSGNGAPHIGFRCCRDLNQRD